MKVPAPQPVLVTGAAGFIAFHLIESLLRQGTPVLGIDNFDSFYPRALKEKNLDDLGRIARETGTGWEFAEQDLRSLDSDLFPGGLGGVPIQSVIHLAAKAGVRPSLEAPEEYLQVNVGGTLRVLEFCRARNISELLFGSSSSVYGNQAEVPFRETSPCDRPISPYAASKRAGELYCATYASLYGVRIAALRFFTVYGPRQRPDLAIRKFAGLIASGKPLALFGDGSTSRDYTFVTDIVAGVHGALDWVRSARPGAFEIFNLGGSKATSLKELVRLIESAIGKPAQIRWEPMQAGDVERTFADVAKSGEKLGYAPRTSIERGIHDFAEWFLSEGAR